MDISLLIAGDVVPRRRTVPLFENLQTDALFPGFRDILKQVDYSLVNFESPVLENSDIVPIKKSGGSLFSNKNTLKVLNDLGFNAITLANNHFRDYGQHGINDTITICQKLKLDYVGGGRDIVESRKVLRVEIKQKIISFINVCEEEFSHASKDHGGSNKLDLINLYEDIDREKRMVDYIIVIIHGGIEHYQLPSLRMKKWYRHIIDLGASAIVNHHQHCFSGYEIYNGKPIFYGLGNFCFDSKKPQSTESKWNKGFCVKFLLCEGGVKFDIIPYVQCAEHPLVKLCKSNIYNDDLFQLNNIIEDDYLLEKSFDKYCKVHIRDILSGLLLYGNTITSKLYRLGLLGKGYNSKLLLTVLNRLRCESHRDTCITLLKSLSKID